MILCFKPYIFASPPGLYTIGSDHAELSGRVARGSHARVARLLHFRYKVGLQHAVCRRRIARRRIARRTA